MRQPFFFLPLLFIVMATFKTNAQKIDWSKQHEDDIINFLAWDGSKVTAKMIGDEFILSNGHKDDIANYLTWDGSKWTSRIEGNVFKHAPNGDWSRAHNDEIINYITHDGKRWTAKLQGNEFIHAPNGDWSKAHKSDHLNYKTWNNSLWTMRIDGKGFRHIEGTSQNIVDGKVKELKYLTWNGSKWRAKKNSDGTFNHSLDGDKSKSHNDVIINYLTHDRTLWSAKVNNGKFVHAPVSAPVKKDEGGGIRFGIPQLVLPANWGNTYTVEGVKYQDQDGLLWYYYSNPEGTCTNHLGYIESSKIVSSSIIGRCSGNRKIVRFVVRR